MKSDHQQIRREQLKEAMRSNPDAVVDSILNLEKRIEELEAQSPAKDEQPQQFQTTQ